MEMTKCYLVGDYLGTRAKAAVRFDSRAEAVIMMPLFERMGIITDAEIKIETDVPLTSYLFDILNKAMR